MNKFPTKINFDICTFCNHKCTFCSNEDKRTLKDKVSKDQFDTVMTNITKYLNIKELGLSAKGEVLINNDLSQIIYLAKNRYNIPYIYISSNGSLLNKENSLKILNAGLDSIKLSINAIDRKEYEKTHQKDDFQIVIENLKYLIYLKKTSFPNLKILISCISNKSEKEIEKGFQKLLNNDIEYINDILKYKITFTPKFNHFNTDTSKLKACPLALNEIYIDSDCRLGLCCKDYFKEFDYGSLLTNDFLELYNSRKMKELREMHISETFPSDHFCTKCLIFDQVTDNEE